MRKSETLPEVGEGKPMAGNKIACPECDAVLKFSKPIPAGKKVRCTKCDAVFRIPEEEDEEPASKAKAKKTSDKVSAKKPGDKAGKPESKPAKPVAEEEDKTYGVVAEQEEHEPGPGKGKGKGEKKEKPKIDYAPDTTIKDLRGPAQAAVIQPTNLMLLCGALGFFGYVGLIIALMIPIVTPLSSDVGTQSSPVTALEIGPAVGAAGSGSAAPPPPGKDDGELQLFVLFGTDLGQVAYFPWHQIILYLSPLAFGILYCLIALLGAVKAQNLESRGWGIAAAIMILFPYTIAGFVIDVLLFLNFALGVMLDQDSINYLLTFLAVALPLGPVVVAIKSLMVFFNKDVIAGFEYVPE